MEVKWDVSNYVTNKDGVIEKDFYIEVGEDGDFAIANIMKKIIEKVTKSQDKATQDEEE